MLTSIILLYPEPLADIPEVGLGKEGDLILVVSFVEPIVVVFKHLLTLARSQKEKREKMLSRQTKNPLFSVVTAHLR